MTPIRWCMNPMTRSSKQDWIDGISNNAYQEAVSSGLDLDFRFNAQKWRQCSQHLLWRLQPYLLSSYTTLDRAGMHIILYFQSQNSYSSHSTRLTSIQISFHHSDICHNQRVLCLSLAMMWLCSNNLLLKISVAGCKNLRTMA